MVKEVQKDFIMHGPSEDFRKLTQECTSHRMASVAVSLTAWMTGLEARFAKLPTPVDGSC